jgi:CBS domain-containing protein
MAPFAVESLMTKKVVRVGLDSPVTEVLNKLRAHHISCVVVCEDETPVGMISERDIVGLAFEYVSGKGDTPQLARELMSSSLTTVRDSDSLGDALGVAEHHRVRHLPVVDGDGRLVGLLTQTDLLRARVRQPEENVSHRTG